MINNDHDQLVKNTLNIDRLIDDVKLLQNMIEVHIDEDDEFVRVTTDKFSHLINELKDLKKLVENSDKKMDETVKRVNELDNFKLKIVSWFAGGSAVIYVLWEILKHGTK